MDSPCDLPPAPPPASRQPPTWAGIHKEYAAYVEALLKPRTPSRDLDDLVQLSFMEINQGLPRYDPARPMQPWIATIVLRTYQRYVRRNALRVRSEEFYSREPCDHEPACEERIEARDLVPQLLACLKDRELEIVLRRLRDEEPIEVISQDLGISPDGGYKLLQTAVAKLKEAKRRQELIEQRQLRRRRGLMLPFWGSLGVQGWIDRARALLGRALKWARGALGGGMFVIALGVLLLPPRSPGALPSQVALPATVARDEGAAVKAPVIVATEEMDRASALVRTVALPASSSPKKATRLSSAARPDHQVEDELSSLSRIEALSTTEPAAARAALELHRKTYRVERLKKERAELDLFAQDELAR